MFLSFLLELHRRLDCKLVLDKTYLSSTPRFREVIKWPVFPVPRESHPRQDLCQLLSLPATVLSRSDCDWTGVSLFRIWWMVIYFSLFLFPYWGQLYCKPFSNIFLRRRSPVLDPFFRQNVDFKSKTLTKTFLWYKIVFE